jgi:hypothetical protein
MSVLDIGEIRLFLLNRLEHRLEHRLKRLIRVDVNPELTEPLLDIIMSLERLQEQLCPAWKPVVKRDKPVCSSTRAGATGQGWSD